MTNSSPRMIDVDGIEFTEFTAADVHFGHHGASENDLPNEVGFEETDLVAADAYFDFDAAAEEDLPNEVGSGEMKPLFRFFGYPTDIHQQANDAMGTQPVQQADQRAAIPDPSPAMAPIPTTDLLQQQWPSLSLMNGHMATGHYDFGESPYPHQPTSGLPPKLRPQGFLKQPSHLIEDPRRFPAGPPQESAHRSPLPAPLAQRFPSNHDLQPCGFVYGDTAAQSSPIAFQPAQQLSPSQHLQQRYPVSGGPPTVPTRPRRQPAQSSPLASQPVQQLSPNQHLQQRCPMSGGSPAFPIGPQRQPAQSSPLAFQPAQQHQQPPNQHLQQRYPMSGGSPAFPTGHQWTRTQSSPLTFPPHQQHQQPANHTNPLSRQGPGSSHFTTQQQWAPSSTFQTPSQTPSPFQTISTATAATADTRHPAPIKGSRPTGITKTPAQSKPRGGKHTDHDNTDWDTTTLQPGKHTNTVWARNMLRSEQRLAQPYNQPSVRVQNGDNDKGQDKGKGEEKATQEEPQERQNEEEASDPEVREQCNK